MNSMTSFIKRHPQGVFWGIAYGISGGGYILSRMYPSDLWPLVIWGILLGGALVTQIADGRDAMRTYFSRLVRWRAGIVWYVLALLTPFALGAISVGLTLVSGGGLSTDFQFPEWSEIVAVYLLSFFTISLGEEAGFRGFALPRFLEGHSAFAASLILGILHAIWHLPLVIGGEEQLITLLNPLCAAFLFTWIFNHTKGSVFIAMLLHASSDTAAGLFNPMFSGVDATMARIWLAVAFVVLAILLRIFASSELGRKADARSEPAGRIVRA